SPSPETGERGPAGTPQHRPHVGRLCHAINAGRQSAQGKGKQAASSCQESRYMKDSTPVNHASAVSAKHSYKDSSLRDFSTTWRVLPISVLALVIGVVAAYVAVILLRLIGFFTNLFFYLRVS